jgi:hypothetical protein
VGLNWVYIHDVDEVKGSRFLSLFSSLFIRSSSISFLSFIRQNYQFQYYTACCFVPASIQKDIKYMAEKCSKLHVAIIGAGLGVSDTQAGSILAKKINCISTKHR